MSSRRLEDLHPDLLPLALQFIKDCKAAEIEILIYCTYRSAAEQNAEYAKGRTKAGKVVTFLKGGQSKHNFTIDGQPASKAFDCAPVVNGVIDWSGEGPTWEHMAAIGKNVGLIWGGDWVMKDKCHWELKGGDPYG